MAHEKQLVILRYINSVGVASFEDILKNVDLSDKYRPRTSLRRILRKMVVNGSIIKVDYLMYQLSKTGEHKPQDDPKEQIKLF